MADRRTVAEGAFTAPVLARLARERGIDMPIVAAVDRIIAQGRVGRFGARGPASRPPRAEGILEIDRDALLLPVAVAGGVGLSLPRRPAASVVRLLGLGHRRRFRQVWRADRDASLAASCPAKMGFDGPPSQAPKAVARRARCRCSIACSGAAETSIRRRAAETPAVRRPIRRSPSPSPARRFAGSRNSTR
jgi:hypothetical protein